MVDLPVTPITFPVKWLAKKWYPIYVCMYHAKIRVIFSKNAIFKIARNFFLRQRRKGKDECDQHRKDKLHRAPFTSSPKTGKDELNRNVRLCSFTTFEEIQTCGVAQIKISEALAVKLLSYCTAILPDAFTIKNSRGLCSDTRLITERFPAIFAVKREKNSSLGGSDGIG